MAFSEDYSIKQKKRVEDETSSWFVGSTHSLEDLENIKKNISEFPYYWYILHDHDEGSTLHIHFVFNLYGSRTIKSVCKTLDCDVQNVQICSTPRGSIRYLVHLDDPDKFQYSISDIVTNDPDRLDLYFKSFNFSSRDLFGDVRYVRAGKMSCFDFLEKYKGELSKLNFYQRFKIMEYLDKMSAT